MNAESRVGPSNKPVGLIGLGLMGTALGLRLRERGFALAAWDRAEKARAAWSALNELCESPNEIFEHCDRILLSLPDLVAVRGVLETLEAVLRPGQYIIDTTTGDPEQVEGIAGYLASFEVMYLDATASGSSEQLAKGQALLMIGGDDEAFTHCQDVFGALSDRYVHVGPSGSGSRMKLVSNLVLGLNRAALGEGLVLAGLLGLDLEATLSVFRESMAYSRIMDTKADKMIRQDFAVQAKLSQHLKDVRIMLDIAARKDGRLPLSEAHAVLLEHGVALGYGELDNSAVYRVIKEGFDHA